MPVKHYSGRYVEDVTLEVKQKHFGMILKSQIIGLFFFTFLMNITISNSS